MIIDIYDTSTYPEYLIRALNNKDSIDIIVELLKDDFLLCYHFTRLYEKDKILNEGLKKSNPYGMAKYVQETYKKVYGKKISIDLKEVLKKHLINYDNPINNKDNTKIGRICFLIGTSKDLYMYKDYYNMFGGECIYNSLFEYEELRNEIANIGNNYVIKFKLPIVYLKDLERIVNKIECIYFMNDKTIIDDVIVEKEIDKKMIMEVKEID